VPVVNIDDARAALRAGRPEELLGVAECGWLDVKSGIYQLDDPASAEELAKDVAAFANTKTGGLLLIGYGTRKEHDVEVIDQVRPVPRTLVDLDRHRKLIRERVIPAPREVVVEWIGCEDGKGILQVDVPAQPPARLPHVVSGAVQFPRGSRITVAIPIREGDATAWLSQAEIQRLLSVGWTNAGGPSDEFLRALIQQTVMAAGRPGSPSAQGPGIGEGEAGWKGAFEQAHADLARTGLQLGRPSTPVQWEGPGVVQYFEQQNGPFGWVLCALPDRRPVAVDGEVWQSMRRAGSGAPGCESPLDAVGFPVPDQDATRIVAASDEEVALTGGRWGKSRLIRDAESGRWRWEPSPRFDMNMTRAARNWTAGNEQILRLRAIATLPWADAGDLSITTDLRQPIEMLLPASGLGGLVSQLSSSRGAELKASEWRRGPNRNAPDWLSCSSITSTRDGRSALEAEVMIALPHAMDSSVVTCAELRVHADAWQEALTESGAPLRSDYRLSIGQVATFLAGAWEMATEILPGAVTGDPSLLPWAYPPVVDLRIIAEERFDSEPHPMRMLDDYVDLAPLGPTDRGQLREMAVTVTAPLVLAPAARRELARQALAYMARQFGFLDTPDWLLAGARLSNITRRMTVICFISLRFRASSPRSGKLTPCRRTSIQHRNSAKTNKVCLTA
jgi:hypothetical protein